MVDAIKAEVESAIMEYIDPYLEKDLITTKMVKDIEINGGKVTVKITLGFPAKGYCDSLAQLLKNKLETLSSIDAADIVVDWEIKAHQAQKMLEPIKNVKNVIAVASAKGGVGKSTTAVNLALALSAEGACVGILDADLYGPSQPRMLGVSDSRPESSDGESLEPVVNYNIQSMSIGFLIDEDTPMIWRGPMVTQALNQLLSDTRWKGLDYLIVDLPPGTGDIQLTLAQKVPVSGAVIVTTPQDIALLDARKGLKMFEKVEIPVLGIVENMSIHICNNCGYEEHIFGQGGGQQMAEQYDVNFLGSLPLDLSIRETTDAGTPSVVKDPNSRISQMYREIARRTAAKLSLHGKNYAAAFPKIVIN